MDITKRRNNRGDKQLEDSIADSRDNLRTSGEQILHNILLRETKKDARRDDHTVVANLKNAESKNRGLKPPEAVAKSAEEKRYSEILDMLYFPDMRSDGEIVETSELDKPYKKPELENVPINIVESFHASIVDIYDDRTDIQGFYVDPAMYTLLSTVKGRPLSWMRP